MHPCWLFLGSAKSSSLSALHFISLLIITKYFLFPPPIYLNFFSGLNHSQLFLFAGLRSVRLTGKVPAFLLCNVKIEEHVQPMKNVQTSTGLFKRASNLRRSLRTSLKKPPSLTIPPTPAPSIPENPINTTNNDRYMEALSDKDSGFMSINSSINSPSRVENNPSPTNSSNGPSGVSYALQMRHSRSTDFPQSPRFFDDPQQTQRSTTPGAIDQVRVNLMLEEAAKAEVLISAEHRKAKSLSITEEMLICDGTNFAPVPPKRAHSFRDKASLFALDFLTLKPQKHNHRDRLEAEPQLSTSLSHRNSIHASASPTYFKKPPSNFLYTVSSPTRESLYKVVEESNSEDGFYRRLSSNSALDESIFLNETFAVPAHFQIQSSKQNVPLNMSTVSWDPSYDIRNKSNQKAIKKNKTSRLDFSTF